MALGMECEAGILFIGMIFDEYVVFEDWVFLSIYWLIPEVWSDLVQ